MIATIVLLLTIFTFILASIEDIKKREVYDFLNFGYFFAVMAIIIVDTIASSSLTPLILGVFGTVAGFFLGALFYYFGTWGGGDAKFMIGLGASSGYLISFASTGFETVSRSVISILGLEILFNSLRYALLLITLIAIGYALYLFLKKRKNTIDILTIITILLLEFVILTNLLAVPYLVILTVMCFILFLFADENIFTSLYFPKKTKAENLGEGDHIEEKEQTHGLRQSDLAKLDKSSFFIKKIQLPYITLIMANLFLIVVEYVFTLNQLLDQLLFLSVFILLSFLIGGIVAIGIITVQFIRNYKKIEFKITTRDKVLMAAVTLAGFLLVSVGQTALLGPIILLIILVPFMKLAKATEEFIFVSDKAVDNIVPGDWIVENVVKGKKTIFKKEEFKLGVSQEQLETLKKTFSKDKTIRVKDGLAFLPPMFLAFIVLLLL